MSLLTLVFLGLSQFAFANICCSGGGSSGGTGITSITTGTAGTDFAAVTAGTAVTLDLPTASAVNRGALSTSNWSTFNGKVSGPGSSTDLAIPKFSGTGGATLVNTGILIDASNRIAWATSPKLRVANGVTTNVNAGGLEFDPSSSTDLKAFSGGASAGGYTFDGLNSSVAGNYVVINHTTTGTRMFIYGDTNANVNWATDGGGSVGSSASQRPNFVRAVTGMTINALPIGVMLNTNFTSVGNVSTGEDDLMTYTLPGGTLGANGDVMEWKAGFSFAANGNNKTVKCYLGATELFTTGAVGINSTGLSVVASLIRVTSTSWKSIISVNSGVPATLAAFSSYVTGTDSLASDAILKCTGEATATDDIVQQILLVKKGPDV